MYDQIPQPQKSSSHLQSNITAKFDRTTSRIMHLTAAILALAATFMPLAVHAIPATVSQPAVVECVKIKHFVSDQFAIRGQHFNSDFLDGSTSAAMSGANLRQEIVGCGLLAGWKFTSLVDAQFGGKRRVDIHACGNRFRTPLAVADIGRNTVCKRVRLETRQWTATGGLPKTAKSGCVARALMTIGAPMGTGCHWLTLRVNVLKPKDKLPTPSDPHPAQDPDDGTFAPDEEVDYTVSV
ncbi:hypothetical protein LTR17_014222 [Elasticomyces elasticus]|nr:hypothetical protein LTR17_014222 [Elasticomyces elasticus]